MVKVRIGTCSPTRGDRFRFHVVVSDDPVDMVALCEKRVTSLYGEDTSFESKIHLDRHPCDECVRILGFVAFNSPRLGAAEIEKLKERYHDGVRSRYLWRDMLRAAGWA